MLFGVYRLSKMLLDQRLAILNAVEIAVRCLGFLVDLGPSQEGVCILLIAAVVSILNGLGHTLPLVLSLHLDAPNGQFE